MQITSKRQFLELYLNNELGNKFRTWRNVDEALADNVQLAGFRDKQPSGWFKMVKRSDFRIEDYLWTKAGKEFYLNEGDYETQSRATIQGEVCITEKGYELFTGPANRYKMREMFSRNLATASTGLTARLKMKHYMNDNSLDEIDLLLEKYPGHVVEFTCYNMHLGILPGRNTIIWEVRAY